MKPIISTTITVKEGKMYETKTQNGRTIQVAIFEDLNGNGKYEENEVTDVFKYSYKENGSYKETTYSDKDKDGTLDVIREQKYDKNGKKLGATTWKEITDKCCPFHSNMQNIRDTKGLSVFHIPNWEME